MITPMASIRWWLWLAFFLAAGSSLGAAEVIPARPTRYFNDYALTVRPETANKLNGELEDLEKQSSNQILVVIYPTMQSESSVEDYCHRIFATWHVGQQGKDNGAVLFVFLKEHHTWIEVNRGLEGSLTDAACADITGDQITPRFKQGDYDGGLTAGVEAMIAATKGEYKGDGQTDYQKQHPATADGGGNGGGISIGTIFFLIILFFIVSRFFRRAGGTTFTGAGPIIWGSMLGGLGGRGGFGGGGFGGGGFGGGGGGGGDSGGFSSGGGGSGAGGGAGSDW